MNNYHHFVKTSLGALLIAADERRVTGIYTPQHTQYDALKRHGKEEYIAMMQPVVAWLQAYMAGEQPALLSQEIPQGTPFQCAVWRALQAIPYGATTSYAQIATQIGSPKAVRAVGSAIGKNPLLILIPCHRVIASNGALAGFAGGIAAKRWLLAHEKTHSFSAE